MEPIKPLAQMTTDELEAFQTRQSWLCVSYMAVADPTDFSVAEARRFALAAVAAQEESFRRLFPEEG